MFQEGAVQSILENETADFFAGGETLEDAVERLAKSWSSTGPNRELKESAGGGSRWASVPLRFQRIEPCHGAQNRLNVRNRIGARGRYGGAPGP